MNFIEQKLEENKIDQAINFNNFDSSVIVWITIKMEIIEIYSVSEWVNMIIGLNL